MTEQALSLHLDGKTSPYLVRAPRGGLEYDAACPGLSGAVLISNILSHSQATFSD